MRRAWPSPLGPFLDRLAEALGAGGADALDGAKRIVLLASGSPMLHGIGASLAKRGLAGRFAVHAGLSTHALACARLGWSEAEVALVSVCGPPIESIVPELHHGARTLVLSADETTPGKVASLLCRLGFGRTTVHVLERLGGPAEAVHALPADALPADRAFDRLNALALEVRADPGTRALPRTGLPDDAFDHDGQITKRDARSSALARLAPQPASSCGTSVPAPGRSASNGAALRRVPTPSASSATPSARRGPARMRRGSARSATG